MEDSFPTSDLQWIVGTAGVPRRSPGTGAAPVPTTGTDGFGDLSRTAFPIMPMRLLAEGADHWRAGVLAWLSRPRPRWGHLTRMIGRPPGGPEPSGPRPPADETPDPDPEGMADEVVPPPLPRLTVELSAAVATDLAELAAAEGMTRSTIVNRAVQIYRWIHDLERSGSSLTVIDATTGTQHRVRFE